jgi:signal transduction histidine kinase
VKHGVSLETMRYEVRILGPVLFLIPLALTLVFAGMTAMLFVGSVVHGFISAFLIAALEACLPLASMDAGQMHLEREVLNLSVLAADVVRREQALAAQEQVTLDVQEEEPAYVLADRVLLEQVVLILLDNALKYNHPGGKISLRTFNEHGWSCLRISDTGEGIAPEHLKRLGERFYRVDKARSRESGGNGLGLSIARGIAAAHEGEITLTSELGKGTIVMLKLAAVTKKPGL